MIKRALLPMLIAVCGVVVFQGCKSDTAKDAKIEPVALLEAGAEPRAPLRYMIKDGTTTTSTMDVSTAAMTTTTTGGEAISKAPGIRVVISSGPAVRLDNGNVRFDVGIVNADAVLPPGVAEDVAKDLNRSAARLKKLSGWLEVDDRGIVQDSSLEHAEKDSQVPARMLLTVVNARTSFARVMLPAEPIGIGAQWETKKEITMFGFKLEQVDRYTLTEKVGDEIKLSVDIVQNAPKQTLTFEEEGVELALQSLSMSAQGEIVLNLNALEGSARAMGQSAEVMTVKTVEGTEEIELNSATTLDMTVRFEISKKKAAELEDAAKKGATGQEP